LEFKKGVCGIFAATGPNLTVIAHLARWHSKMDWKIAVLISEEKSVIIAVHIVEIW